MKQRHLRLLGFHVVQVGLLRVPLLRKQLLLVIGFFHGAGPSGHPESYI